MTPTHQISRHHGQSYVLSFRCPDRLGVVARYSGVLYERGVKVIGAW